LGRTGSRWGRRARGKGEDIGKREAADFVWLYYRSHVLSPSPAQQYKEIGVKKEKKKERETPTTYTSKASGAPPRQRQAVPLTATRERDEERESVCFRSERKRKTDPCCTGEFSGVGIAIFSMAVAVNSIFYQWYSLVL
jgi:hypothetical protein